MRKYWTHSKFGDWLRGTPKLLTGTSEEWNAWEKQAKIKKLRYWLAEEGLDYLQRFIYWPTNRIKDACFYINNRWVTKSHALTSHLKRGEWHDLDTRLLHAVFDELVNFVEIELAWMLVISSKDEQKKYNVPWYRTFFRISIWRNPEAGLAYLKWASELTVDEDWVDKNHPNYGQPTHQALAAQETLKLYQWWKEERQKRPDPSDASGWSKYCEEKRNEAKACADDSWHGFISSNREDERSVTILNLYHKIEKEQEEEDTAMLIRLIQIRQSFWT